jgi:2-oxoglutarate dehydrogenase E2 component (dihydrolipoamide succinyltransferase)
VAQDTAPVAASADLTLSPAVRRLVLELGIDPTKVKGSGKDGRLTKEDVLAAAKGGAPTSPSTPAAAPVAAPAPAAAVAGERREERVRMTRLRQTIAKRLKDAQNTAALLTTFNDVDMSAVMEARNRYKDSFEKKHGVKLGFMSFFAKAACLALKDFPRSMRRSRAMRSSIMTMSTSRLRFRPPMALSSRWSAMSTSSVLPISRKRSAIWASAPRMAP